jgi:poly(3-hydroxybutyrate) depolymerase
MAMRSETQAAIPMHKFIAAAVGLGICFATVLGCTVPGKAVDVQLSVAGGSVGIHVPAVHGSVGVVLLHSLDNDASEPVAQGWSKASDKYGFVAIYPDNGGTSWNAGLCCGPAMAANRDDVTFLTTVIAQMKARYQLTTIYISGYSNGGMMAERLVVERPTLTRRIALWARHRRCCTPVAGLEARCCTGAPKTPSFPITAGS